MYAINAVFKGVTRNEKCRLFEHYQGTNKATGVPLSRFLGLELKLISYLRRICNLLTSKGPTKRCTFITILNMLFEYREFDVQAPSFLDPKKAVRLNVLVMRRKCSHFCQIHFLRQITAQSAALSKEDADIEFYETFWHFFWFPVGIEKIYWKKFQIWTTSTHGNETLRVAASNSDSCREKANNHAEKAANNAQVVSKGARPKGSIPGTRNIQASMSGRDEGLIVQSKEDKCRKENFKKNGLDIQLLRQMSVKRIQTLHPYLRLRQNAQGNYLSLHAFDATATTRRLTMYQDGCKACMRRENIRHLCRGEIKNLLHIA